MAEEKEYVTCTFCNGSGQIYVYIPEVPPEGENPGTPAYDKTTECPECKGEGKRIAGNYRGGIDIVSIQGKLDDMDDKINDIMDKCNDIFEAVSE